MRLSNIVGALLVIVVSATSDELWCCAPFGPDGTLYNPDHAKPTYIGAPGELVCLYGSDQWNVNCNYDVATGLLTRGQTGCPTAALANLKPGTKCPDVVGAKPKSATGEGDEI
ncbi:hypothetical protein LshimejAT787_0312050 [Lyophyllum shimeji]|uniref:Secreted protein n=1 Tax=Lyophyllum shimeji TaxID=47721 RepID=A0A9P3PK31_LYOSH|nr:hypothetical protein LshimejAT787_0312050 [Lyophyllum shimeji]